MTCLNAPRQNTAPLREVMRSEWLANYRKDFLECGHTAGTHTNTAVVPLRRRCPKCVREIDAKGGD